MKLTQSGINHRTRSTSYKGLLNGTVVHVLPHFPALPARLAVHELTGTTTSDSLQRFSEMSLLAVRLHTGLLVLESYAFPASAYPLSYLYSTSENVILLQHFRSFCAGRSFSV